MTFNDVWTQYKDAIDESYRTLPTSSDMKRTEENVLLNRKIDMLVDLVLGHPDSFDRVRCWMVDAKGSTAECDISKKLVKAMHQDAESELGHKYIEEFGALPAEVRSVMSKWNLTDSGGGCGRWHLGCHSTEKEAKEICIELHTKFKHAINSGILVVERKPWSLALKLD
ncbi:MAG: hypothetical protein M0R50_08685 [Candidatus Cloacimonetes bacterium]|jgi:hypothetical protein|nr:hypothetical protein [Candidatus Cloacimonadota bacterium]